MTPLPPPPPHPAGSQSSPSDPIPVYPPSNSSSPTPQRQQQPPPPQQQQQQQNRQHAHPSSREARHQQNTDLQAPPRSGGGGGGQQRFGQYVIIKTLGEGSFGKVKLAVHQVTGQKVALKIISRRKLVNRDMAGRVEREIQYLQLLRHPHIIKLYNVVTTNTEIVMVIEYAGRELFDYIVTHGRMSEDGARRFFQQIICAVEYCHRHKIVHRDLKPENLLLDEFLNVKIADFGLSNIMTDGNFLKTSCGSPNYAAPEVISGKLYAGPEVDVWSCGVILYVLLCGRLPFDDDYIPTLFKKISQGSYSVPSYLSPEAVTLLRKMLVVNPVNRITVAEIRQDPWFKHNLPEYLRSQEDEFVDTGVDTRQHPTQSRDTRGAKAAGELHEAVVGKLKKTLGYGNEDVHEALGKEEPNAIKDAYNIVRENQMMMRDSRLSNAQNIQSFLAQSPPAWNSPSANLLLPHGVSALKPQLGDVQAGSSPFLSTPNRTASPLTLSDRAGLGLSVDEAAPGGRSPNSSICILPTSLPEYHRDYMASGPRAAATTTSMALTDCATPGPCTPSPVHGGLSSLPISAVSSPLQCTPSPLGPGISSGGISSGTTYPAHRRTHGSLRPLATKSQQSTSGAGRPEPLTPLSNTQFQQQMMQRQQMTHQPQEAVVKKPKPTRWQFGIRSRNPPLEAVSCIYRALKKLGAEWVTADEDDEYSDEYDSDEYSGSDGHESQIGREDTNYGGDEGSPRITRARGRSPGSGGDEKDGEIGDRRKRRRSRGDGEKERIVPPQDPWVIHCRWRKDGMVPVKNENGSFGHQQSAASSLASTPKDGGSMSTGSSRRASTATGVTEDWTESVYVHMEIQLYKLENNFYLVDFKCAGYERVFDDEDDYSSDSGSGDEYEFDDGIPEEGYVPEDEDEPMITTAGEKRVLGAVNPDLNEGGGEIGNTSDGQGGSKKKVGFVDGDGDGETLGGRSRRGSDNGHPHHHHHHHHSGDDGMSGRGRKPQEDKDVTSPFPFLDMATKLIIQLAEAD
ncbi:hypothetical protein BGX38DRAFT_1156170 [Terfezia claveryi]|nr:hypothetical protein BGX38DRAFT_1156170 [Terfezia claveryi]